MVVSEKPIMMSAARELGTAKVFGFFRARLDEIECPIETLALCEEDRIVVRQFQPGEQHAAPHHRLQRAVGKMKPEQKRSEVRVPGAERETAAAILRNDVLHDGA